MKHLFKNILVLAVMLGTFTSYGTESFKIFSNLTTKRNTISVTDDSGKTIYTGRVSYNGDLTSLYDFTNLKDGIYFIEIDKDFEIITNTIKVKNHVVTFLNSTSETFFKPIIKIEDAKLMVSKSSFQEENIEVEIFYENDLIYSENVIANPILKRVYKLDSDVKGNYTAIIKANNRAYIENFKL